LLAYLYFGILIAAVVMAVGQIRQSLRKREPLGVDLPDVTQGPICRSILRVLRITPEGLTPADSIAAPMADLTLVATTDSGRLTKLHLHTSIDYR
jgi:hypothetical protein